MLPVTISLILCSCTTVFAAQFNARIVDNLGQPIAGARLSAYCAHRHRDGLLGKEHKLFTLTSGPDGTVSGIYKDHGPSCKQRVVIASDATPFPQSYGSFRTIFVVRRRASAEQIDQIAKLRGSDLQLAVRNLITSSVEGRLEERTFQHADLLRPSLRSLATDPDAGIPARKLLAFIGDPDDLRLIVGLGVPTEEGFFEYRWLYGVLCSLLNPDSDPEWDLLRRSAAGEFQDGWVFGGALQTLKLIASPRSRQILEQISADGSPRGKSALRAMQYIDSTPAPLRDQNLEQLGVRVGKIIGGESWTGNQEPLYDGTFDRALINIKLDTTSDYFLYIAVFQRVDGTWMLRGVREQLQAMKMAATSVQTKPK